MYMQKKNTLYKWKRKRNYKTMKKERIKHLQKKWIQKNIKMIALKKNAVSRAAPINITLTVLCFSPHMMAAWTSLTGWKTDKKEWSKKNRLRQNHHSMWHFPFQKIKICMFQKFRWVCTCFTFTENCFIVKKNYEMGWGSRTLYSIHSNEKFFSL